MRELADYQAMPKRVSPLMQEIESNKALQDEQITLAYSEKELLLYYISGGNEQPKTAKIIDTVRPEDQDLRGWFTETYGNYFDHLTSEEENGKTNNDRITQIIAAFNTNDYGYTLRAGAVNAYHIGRIVTHANNMYKHRKEAINYSLKLATSCSKLLFSGEPPNNNVFDILHSSIRNWYENQGITITLPFERLLGQGKIRGGGQYTQYIGMVIMSLFDMHKFSMPADSWHNYVLPKADVHGYTPENIVNMLSAIDGVGELTANNIYNEQLRIANNNRDLNTQIQAMVDKGWDQPPKVTQDLFNKLQNTYNKWQNLMSEAVKAKWQNMLLNTAVGDNVPRGFYYQESTGGFMSGSKVITTDSLYIDHDSYLELKTQFDTNTASMLTLTTQRNSAMESDDVANFHKLPAIDIWSALPDEEAGKVTTYKSKWISYIYARVKLAYGFSYETYKLEIAKNQDGSPKYSPYPVLYAPTLYGQQVTATNYVDISKTIFFYGKALLGVSPTAYWTANLSYRLFIRQEGNDSTGPYSVGYLYDANMKTGGIKSGYTVIGKVPGEVESAMALLGAFLPDVPLYKPGDNPKLTGELKSSYETQVNDSPPLRAWITNPNKGQFHYAYVTNSSWDPVYNLNPKLTTRAATYLLGTRGGKWYEEVSSSNPAIGNTHTDWLRATTYSGSKFKGITTFKPSLKTLHYDPVGVYLDSPEFYNARNAAQATKLYCVAFPTSTTEKIVDFMNSVPTRIANLLNQATNIPNSPWYERSAAVAQWRNVVLFGGWNAVESNWAEIPRKQFDRAPGSRSTNRTFYDKRAFLDIIEPMATFLFDRTEALFIKDPATLIERAYAKLLQNKPALPDDVKSGLHYYNITNCYDVTDFGDIYQDYMALLGAITYFNSYHMLLDTSGVRTYPEWCKPFRGKIDAIISSVIGKPTHIIIYDTVINDTEDVSSMHQVLNGLGAFEGMTEMPVLDIPEFHVKWTSRGPSTTVIDNPFAGGIPQVPVGGLEAQAFPGLNNTYGDVFYDTITNTAVLQPVFRQLSQNMYMYSTLRIPVNTRGVSSKIYGMRPGTSYSFDSQAVSSGKIRNLKSGGSGQLTYTGLAGATGLAFIGLLGVTMFKNINAEGAFSDQRWKIE